MKGGNISTTSPCGDSSFKRRRIIKLPSLVIALKKCA
jgi:hypothetical protein